ncbi:MAG TPA: nuclear transport factor 2 family protein [Thermoanaerobaculia bacterium]|nr:nuclear transport factor 2 family protein [Thermoanaerobaculia bacterium]
MNQETEPGTDSDGEEVLAILRRINSASTEGRPGDLPPLFHPEITMVFPCFAGRAHGREAVMAGFTDFCENARVHLFHETDHQVDVVGGTAVASFTFEMVYERAGERCRSTGRDLWVFARWDGEWRAVWRTMLDVAEKARG